jgi:hypothetical protein
MEIIGTAYLQIQIEEQPWRKGIAMTGSRPSRCTPDA